MKWTCEKRPEQGDLVIDFGERDHILGCWRMLHLAVLRGHGGGLRAGAGLEPEFDLVSEHASLIALLRVWGDVESCGKSMICPGSLKRVRSVLRAHIASSDV